MSGTLDGKVVLVTGGGSGIGRATARALAREGAEVVVTDLVDEGGNETLRLIEEAGGKGMFIRGDVAASADVQAIVRTIEEQYGRLDCAFNNAGIEGVQAPTAECTEENWDRVLTVNLKGTWLCMKYEIPLMLKQHKGAIVNTASVAGLVGFPNIAAYNASKGGVIQLTKTAALEYAKDGIRVNAVCPGVIRTPMVERFLGDSAEAEAQFVAMEPIGRMGTPEEIAEAVVWLCSDASSFVTGDAMPVDGGLVAQ
ncbi:MAG TPA: SDR family oxidoreductase [Kribbella sp.]|nr:SDR family oxidoreductase [Kribbella sp.]